MSSNQPKTKKLPVVYPQRRYIIIDPVSSSPIIDPLQSPLKIFIECSLQLWNEDLKLVAWLVVGSRWKKFLKETALIQSPVNNNLQLGLKLY